MGQCGCGEYMPQQAWKLGDTTVVLEVYPGCQYCCSGIGLTIDFLTEKGAIEWVDDNGIQRPEIVPTEYPQQHVGQIELFSVEDMQEACLLIDAELGDDGLVISDYSSVSDLLSVHGLRLIQLALQIRLKKERESRKKANR